MPAGTVVASGSLVAPGGQQGVPGPNAVSADAGNQATFGSDARIYVPDPTPIIISVRLRSFNAVGNSTFEVDQRNVGTQLTNPAWVQDRWQFSKAGTMSCATQQIVPGTLPMVPGTNFLISRNSLQVVLGTQQASLGAGDFILLNQVVEGPNFRELSQDQTSLSLLVYCTAALKFAVALRDPSSSRSLVSLCTISTPSVWTLITLPVRPVWSSGGSFSMVPGAAGYMLGICLAAGSSYIAPVSDVWQNGNFIGASGMDNFAGKAVNTQFIIGFVQHEPGSQCTTPQDLSFAANLDSCLRYYWKSVPYNQTVPNSGPGNCFFFTTAGTAAYMAGEVAFSKPLAKAPTMRVWNNVATLNSVNVFGQASLIPADTFSATDKAFSTMHSPQTLSSGYAMQFNCDADTGF